MRCNRLYYQLFSLNILLDTAEHHDCTERGKVNVYTIKYTSVVHAVHEPLVDWLFLYSHCDYIQNQCWIISNWDTLFDYFICFCDPGNFLLSNWRGSCAC